jgi:hypothetical protein
LTLYGSASAFALGSSARLDHTVTLSFPNTVEDTVILISDKKSAAGGGAQPSGTWKKPICRERRLDAHGIWGDVEYTSDARDFLIRHLRSHGVGNFAEWLSCQGFSVTVYSGPFPSIYLKEDHIKIEASYPVADKGGGPLWREGLLGYLRSALHSQEFSILVDRDENLIAVGFSDTVK